MKNNKKMGEWHEGAQPIPLFYEQSKPEPIVIYNHLGEPLTQACQKLGFDLTPAE